ncbi:EamA-like transporter family protein [Haemophilus pittmaniae HK 85]|uniref:EamA-like transporter family protein n=1 Tax=Haemophilus pittmaniae HK 85 TaxID=1035188 RepID=F9Q883_9PAST|nr:EamA family transporter [Haemophilus pittmaniae]EGV06223.1 EamA-like transporter family protein [Haemophilus pittmaniae HK 85]SNV71021.1 sodium/panthothenate symporter [Haemophilus pittmaniae]
MIYQILALFIWSSAFVAAKFVFAMLDPVLMIQARLLIATLIVLPLFLRRWKGVSGEMRKQLWWLAFLNYTATFLLQFIGLKYTSAASASTMLGLEPLCVIFIGHLFFQDKAKWFHWLCGLLAFIGVGVLIIGGQDNSGHSEINVFGCLLVLAASIVFAASLRWTKKVIASVGTEAYTSITIMLGTIATIPFTLLLTESWHIEFNWLGFFGLLYLGIACSWFAFWLWNKGLNSVDAKISGILVALEPIFGSLLAVLLLGEQLSWLSSLGIVLIIASTIGASLLPKLLKKN